MKRWPLGVQLTCWSVLIVGSALAVSLACTRAYLEDHEQRELDSELSRAAGHFLDQFHQRNSRLDWVTPHEVEEVLPAALDPTRFLIISAKDGHVLFRSRNSPPEEFLKFQAGAYTTHVRGTEVRLCVLPNDKLTFYIAGDTSEIHTLITKVTEAHLVALPLVLALVSAGGWWLARQALKPVRVIADAADAIRPEELSKRLIEPPRRDEVGRLTRAFNRMLERLERGFRQATRFSADASHELRTPLTVLRMSLSDLINDPDLPESCRDAVADLQMQTQGLISVTNSLLTLARADAGRLQLELEDADLADIVTDCLEDAQILADQSGITVFCEPPVSCPVKADAVRIRQILLNLLDNAVKYNEPGGYVRVQLISEDHVCRWHVGNSGPGIPAAAQPNLFERFFRAGQQEDAPGAGLGLSLARELARHHGGELALVSSENGWTEFALTLPRRRIGPAVPIPKVVRAPSSTTV